MAEEIAKEEEKLADSIIKSIFEKQGNSVVKLDMRSLENRVCDLFIITHGNNDTHVEAISYSVEDNVRKELGVKPFHREGLENRFWVLLDYGAVIVHIFQEEFRNFYNLENLWADSVREDMKDTAAG